MATQTQAGWHRRGGVSGSLFVSFVPIALVGASTGGAPASAGAPFETRIDFARDRRIRPIAADGTDFSSATALVPRVARVSATPPSSVSESADCGRGGL